MGGEDFYFLCHKTPPKAGGRGPREVGDQRGWLDRWAVLDGGELRAKGRTEQTHTPATSIPPAASPRPPFTQGGHRCYLSLPCVRGGQSRLRRDWRGRRGWPMCLSPQNGTRPAHGRSRDAIDNGWESGPSGSDCPAALLGLDRSRYAVQTSGNNDKFRVFLFLLVPCVSGNFQYGRSCHL